MVQSGKVLMTKPAYLKPHVMGEDNWVLHVVP